VGDVEIEIIHYCTQSTMEGSGFGSIRLWVFCFYIKYLGNRQTDLRQIHTEDVFRPWLGRVWRLKVKVTRDKKRHFSALSATCMALCLVKRL